MSLIPNGNLPPLVLKGDEFLELELTFRVSRTFRPGTITPSIIVEHTLRSPVSGIVVQPPRRFTLQELRQMDARLWQDLALGATKNSCLQVLEELCTRMQLDGELRSSDET